MSSKKNIKNLSRGQKPEPALSQAKRRHTKNLGKFSGGIIKIINLSKFYNIYNRPLERLIEFFGLKKSAQKFSALKNINLEIKKGETIGIIGVNGSGKSTLLQIIAGTLAPSSGKLEVNGRISALLELGSGFNPEFSGRENVFLNAAILGLSKAQIIEKYNSIVEFSGLSHERLEQPVKTYSSGMYVRLAFAVAVSAEPDILIIDEALSVGDEAFQRKSFARIREIKENGGTVIMVSHSAQHIIDLCDRVVLIDKGEVILEGEAKKVVQNYHKLIFAPEEKREQTRIKIIKGLEDKDKGENFNERLISESMVSYEKHGAEIFDVTLKDSKNKKVNIVKTGENYKLSYKVKFYKAASGIKFGMLIKTLTGVELGGASTAVEKDSIKAIKAGETKEISFSFKASLLPGTYFINTGASGLVDGERTFLHRITDAYMFKILPNTTLKETGLVDFNITSRIKKSD